MVKEGQNAPERGGLAGAGAAGEEHHLLAGGGFHGLHLEGGVGDALLPLDAVDESVQILGGTEFLSLHGQKLVGHIGLAVVELAQVAGILPGDLLPDDLVPVQKPLHDRFQGVLRGAQKLGGGGKELAVGQEDVAVVQVVGQGVEKACLQTEGVVSLDAHG